MAVTLADHRGVKPTWCPGCGDFAVVASLQQAFVKLGIAPENAAVVSGIGCSGKISQYGKAYGFHTLHGRSLPVAQAVKLANRDLTVVAAGGDGDGYGIGMGHLVHAIRRNTNMTYMVMNNQIYGLTVGQASPTSGVGHKTKTTPYGNVDVPIDPLELALSQDVSFLARGFSGNPKQLAELIAEAISHPGFALIDIFSPCVTFNKINTYETFRADLKPISEVAPNHDVNDIDAATKLVRETNGMVTGVIYKSPNRPTSAEDNIYKFAKTGLATHDIAPNKAIMDKAFKYFA